MFFPTVLIAQQQGATKPAGGPSAPTSPASTAGLTGLSFARGTWSKNPPTDHNQAMLCYKLVPAKSASQPFTLQPTYLDPADPTNLDPPKRKNNPCLIVNDKHPLLAKQTVVLAIDTRKTGNMTGIAVLNFNLASTQGTPLNPSPVRPSSSTSSTPLLAAEGNEIYYFRWPVQLTGDILPTLTVNAVYIAPVPGAAWTAHTLYPAGSVVRAVPDNGHFYTTANEGKSGGGPVAFAITLPKSTYDSPGGVPLTWSDLGTSTPPGQATPFAAWAPLKQFTQGAVIFNPLNGHFYAATTGGQSGNTMPTFSTTVRSTIAEPPAGSINWKEIGTALPAGITAVQWAPNATFIAGQVVPFNGHYFTATVGGQSGSTPPFPASPTAGASVTESPVVGPPLTWTDLGTGIPSGIIHTLLFVVSFPSIYTRCSHP